MDQSAPVEFCATPVLVGNRVWPNLNNVFIKTVREADESATPASDEAADGEKALGTGNGENQKSEVSSSGHGGIPEGHEQMVENKKMILIDCILEPVQCNPLSENQEEFGQAVSDNSAEDNKFANTVQPGNQMFPRPVDLIVPNFEGPCKFGIIFPGIKSRTPCVHMSELVNKVFLRMNSTFVVKFTLDPTQAPTTDLYVRASLKFIDMDVLQFSVDRCKVHMLEDDPNNKSHEFEQLCKCAYFNLAGHVLRSSTLGAIYCYDPISQRHSVMSPLKGRSHDVIYSLHCKSSCPKGINRRPMRIVFTLELLNGAVLGQTSLEVKVCSSPKRDRDRHDAELRNNTVKRRRVFYEEILPNRNVTVPNPGTEKAPCVANHIEASKASKESAPKSSKQASESSLSVIKERIDFSKKHLTVAMNSIDCAIKCLNEISKL